MFKTPIVSILCFVVASLLGAVGQFIFKSASDKMKEGVLAFLLDIRIYIGMLCYIAVMGLFVYAFKRGGSVTVLYPIYASTFIWAAIPVRNRSPK